MVDKVFLITRPNYERTTSYLYHWSVGVIALASKRVVKVLDLAGEKASRRELTGRLNKMSPDFVQLNGHGGALSVRGQDGEIILDQNNATGLAGKIVYALSCRSAVKLGPLATARGAKAYIGYKEDFIFFAENSKYAHPMADGAARLFLKPAMKVSESILKGKSVDEAVKIAKSDFTKSILEAANSEVQCGYSAYIPYILWDREHLVYSGDGKAKLE